jgi:hypothetical protein
MILSFFSKLIYKERERERERERENKVSKKEFLI